MPNYYALKQAINTYPWTNNDNLIQGRDVQQCLIAMINELGAGYQFAGVATEQTNPGTPDYNVFYLAGPGTYGNFGGEIIATGFIGVFSWNGSWSVGRIAVSSGGSGGAAWGQTADNFSPLTIGAETKTVALQGHEHNFSAVLGGVSGTKSDGVVVQWDASLNSGAGGWKYSLSSGNYFAFQGWASDLPSNDADAMTFGAWVYANNEGSVTANTPIYGGAILSFGVSVNYGPAQLIIDSTGNNPYYRIRWGNEWRGWHGFATTDTNQTITGAKTFGNHILTGSNGSYDLGAGTAGWRSIYISDSSSAIYITDGTTPKSILGVSKGATWANLFWGDGVKTEYDQHFRGKNIYFRINNESNDALSIVSSAITTRKTIQPVTSRDYDLGASTLFWKHIYAEDHYAKSFISWYKQGESYGDETADGGFHFYARNSSGTYLEGLRITPNEVTACANGSYTSFSPGVDGINLGNTSHLWEKVYAKGWYPTNATTGTIPRVEYITPSSGTPYFKVVGDLVVEGTISGQTANSFDLTAPKVRVYKGLDSLGSAITPTIVVEHELLHDTRLDAQPVLMIWGKKRGRNRGSVGSWKIQYSIGRWGEARGKLATTEPLLWAVGGTAGNETGARSISSLRTFILHQYICGKGYTEAQMRSMTLATFTSATSTLFRFGAKHSFTGTDADFKRKTKAHRLFGIAIRYTNPEFLEVWDGSTLAETTREIDDPNVSGRKIARYIYTEVTPFRVFCHETGAGPTASINSLGLEWQPIAAPHT